MFRGTDELCTDGILMGGRLCDQKVLRCKVIIVGDAHVGKTAISQVFLNNGQGYPKNYVMVSWLFVISIAHAKDPFLTDEP